MFSSMIWFCSWGLILSVPLLILLHFFFRFSRTKVNFKDTNVIISGASSGIGLHKGIICAKKGAANIILLARDEKKLQSAKELVQKNCMNPNAKVYALSCDVSKKESVQRTIEHIVNDLKIDDFHFVFLNQGFAEPGYFLLQSDEVFERHIQVNYLGNVYIARRVLPYMIHHGDREKRFRHLIIVGSVMSAYAPSKYAARSLAETLENEMVGHFVKVHLATPADTETPGFEKENLTKPKETAILSEAGSLHKPEDVARLIIEDVSNGRFYVGATWLTHVLISITRGIGDGTCPIFGPVMTSLGSLIALFVRWDFNQKSLQFSEHRKTLFNKSFSEQKWQK